MATLGEEWRDPARIEPVLSRVRARLRRRVRHCHDVDDVVQECWLRALQQRHDLHSLQAWLTSVAKRVLVEWRRADERRWLRERESARPDRVERDPMLIEPSDAIDCVTLGRSLDRLSESHRRVLVLHYLEGLAIPDIARHTGASSATVRSRIKRARDSLRAQLDPKVTDRGAQRESRWSSRTGAKRPIHGPAPRAMAST